MKLNRKIIAYIMAIVKMKSMQTALMKHGTS